MLDKGLKGLWNFVAFMICLSFIFVLASSFVNAADDGLIQCGRDSTDPVCGYDDLFITLQRVLDFVILYIAIPIAVIVVIIGGFNMIFSMGNEAKFKKGKEMITSIAVGLAITFGAWLIVTILLKVFFNQEIVI